MKPILFNTAMVRAILEGRKTVTRRVVNPQPQRRLVPTLPQSCWPGYFEEEGTPRVVRPPYYSGDILYVRETWTKLCGSYLYKADQKHGMKNPGNWRPSIHMPHEAARIFLRVADVRVERLQDMPVLDIAFEGFRRQRDFIALWNSTTKPADRALYGWEANPWVWVIEFEQIRREEEKN